MAAAPRGWQHAGDMGDTTDAEESRDRLIRLLRLAYSGELAAANAYRGHWRSVRDPDQRARIRRIEEEERVHRRDVGEFLAALGSPPDRLRDRCMGALGTVLGLLCHVGGWYLPMYGAGRLETQNVHEYDDAARFAGEGGHPEMVERLRQMADLEQEHERYFMDLARAHPLWRVLRWQPAERSSLQAPPGPPGTPPPATADGASAALGVDFAAR